MRKTHRLIALLLAVLMLVGIIPVQLFAEEAETPTGSESETAEEVSVLDALTATAYTANTTATASDTSNLGNVHLVLDSSIKIRLALLAAPADASTIVIRNKNGDIAAGGLVNIGGSYYIDIEGVTVSDFNDPYTVTVDGAEINISAMAIANAVATGDYSDSFKELMKAASAYYYYATEYVKAGASA